MATRRKPKVREEEVEVEETELEEGEEVEGEETEVEETEEVVEDDEAEEDTYPLLPEVTEPLSGTDEGFDFFGTVHNHLKESGYVNNQAETKELLRYMHQMIFFDAFENGSHKIPGLGQIVSEIKPSVTRTATFDMPSGVKKGEEYETHAKHVFKFHQSGKATAALAEISELEGWGPENFLGEEEEGGEE